MKARVSLAPGDLTKVLFTCAMWDEAPAIGVRFSTRNIEKDSIVIVISSEVTVPIGAAVSTTESRFVRVLSCDGLGWVNRIFLWDEMP